MAIDDLSTLEYLRIARANAADLDNEANYGDWTSCTCGHIYMAACGQRAEQNSLVLYPTGFYARVIEETANALGFSSQSDILDPVSFISNRTLNYIHQQREREGIVAILDKAISAIEQEEEKARLDVLAQMKQAVESVELASSGDDFGYVYEQEEVLV